MRAILSQPKSLTNTTISIYREQVFVISQSFLSPTHIYREIDRIVNYRLIKSTSDASLAIQMHLETSLPEAHLFDMSSLFLVFDRWPLTRGNSVWWRKLTNCRCCATARLRWLSLVRATSCTSMRAPTWTRFSSSTPSTTNPTSPSPTRISSRWVHLSAADSQGTTRTRYAPPQPLVLPDEDFVVANRLMIGHAPSFYLYPNVPLPKASKKNTVSYNTCDRRSTKVKTQRCECIQGVSKERAAVITREFFIERRVNRWILLVIRLIAN